MACHPWESYAKRKRTRKRNGECKRKNKWRTTSQAGQRNLDCVDRLASLHLTIKHRRDD